MSDRDPLRILIVEDETIPAHYLASIIEEDADWVVTGIVPDAKEALAHIAADRPQVILMDIMIRGALSGAELAVRIHDRYPEILIVFVTAYSTEEMITYAADAEAFAYLLKPYRPQEIHATLTLAKARLRRAPASPRKFLELADGYRCRLETMRLEYRGEEVALSAREKALIELLCRNARRVLESEVIMEQLQINNTALRALIYRLRKNTSEHLIVSVKRQGYRIGMGDSNP